MISGPVVESISKSTVEAGPGECPFELRHAFTKERATGQWYKYNALFLSFAVISFHLTYLVCLCSSFRVMTYNILAGMYSDTEAAKSELFAHCPPYALDIDYRKQLLMKEILGIIITLAISSSECTLLVGRISYNYLKIFAGYKVDIMCLQEVDERVFENDLQPILGLQGYLGIFHKKGSVKEGLACLFNTKRFR